VYIKFESISGDGSFQEQILLLTKNCEAILLDDTIVLNNMTLGRVRWQGQSLPPICKAGLFSSSGLLLALVNICLDYTCHKGDLLSIDRLEVKLRRQESD
jgi:hypothetical protein